MDCSAQLAVSTPKSFNQEQRLRLYLRFYLQVQDTGIWGQVR